jgi:hypothetical protein
MTTMTEAPAGAFDDVEVQAYEADRARKWRQHMGMTGEYRVRGHRAPRRPMLAAQLWLALVLGTLKKFFALRRSEAPAQVTVASMLATAIGGPNAGRTAAQREAARYRRQRRQDMLFELRDWLRTIMLCTLCVTFVALCGTLLWMVWR